MESYDESAVKKDLVGVLLDYKYPGEKGPHYVVAIHPDKLDFKSLWPDENAIQTPSPKQDDSVVEPLSGGVEYRARKIQEGLYLVHWIVNKQIHVALLFDFINKKTTCAALMPGQTELWEVASWDRWQLPSATLKKYQGKGHP